MQEISAKVGRREFINKAAVGIGGALVVRGLGLSPEAAALDFKIERPFHGAVLNHRHGEESASHLEIEVSGAAPPGAAVKINGAEARREGYRFHAPMRLLDQETEIVASCESESGHAEHRIRVVWDRGSFPRYRFSIDDNSFFLRDIAQKQYSSLFDCFYLSLLKDLNQKYGAKFVLNAFYTTEDGFDLSQFSDRYKGEWQENSDWLSLSFHAHANMPDRPYEYAQPAKLIADFDRVTEQIYRFAGEETYSPPTVIHWAMVRRSALEPLYERGVRVLSGEYRQTPDGWDINYHLEPDRCEYLSRHDALKDYESGIVFSKVDMVCNGTPLPRIVPQLEAVSKDRSQAEVMDLFTHEQYFWPFWRNYLPDHAERLDRAIRWVTEKGYKPVFFHEGFLGNPV